MMIVVAVLATMPHQEGWDGLRRPFWRRRTLTGAGMRREYEASLARCPNGAVGEILTLSDVAEDRFKKCDF
jgi:hypothetical protein